jgi:hypothetical protein
MRNIPKTAYFYWGAELLPFLRFMTIYSFRKYHPSWRIVLCSPQTPNKNYNWPDKVNKWDLVGDDYMSLAKKLVDEVRTINMEDYGLSNDLPEVTKSDYLRLHLLSNEFGLWLDMDILFFHPIEYAFLRTSHLTYVCYQPHKPDTDPYHSIGLLMGGPGNVMWKHLLDNAKQSIHVQDYQAIGSPFYGRLIDANHPEVMNFSNNIIYPIRWPDKIWGPSASEALGMMKPETIGIHWYAGHPTSAKFQNELTEDNYRGYDNVICYYLHQILSR